MESESQGIYLDWLDDQRILRFTVSMLRTSTVTEWVDTVIETLSRWPSHQPCLLMYDLTAPGVSMPFLVLTNSDIGKIGITAGGEEMIGRVLAQRPELTIRLALILASSVSGRITAGRGRLYSVDPSRVEARAFFGEESALRWLRSLQVEGSA